MDLASVLEAELVAGACEAYRSGADTSRATMLRCGKWMFFHETFATIGPPTNIFNFNLKHFSDTVFGPGFSSFGFIPYPGAEPSALPIGLEAQSPPLAAQAPFTCASCHFGRLPDGRYAVGQANHDLRYGQFLMAFGAVFSLYNNPDNPKVPEEIRELFREPLQQKKMDAAFRAEFGITALGLLGELFSGSVPQMTEEQQAAFMRLNSGTMDFLTEPIADDGVWTVSSIMPLWNLPDAEVRAQHGMPHEMLSWTAGGHSLMGFLEGFVRIGKGNPADWPVEKLRPLEEYIRTLRAPPPTELPDSAAVERGRTLFNAQCLECHGGPSGMGTRAYTFEEMGTDPAMRQIFSPTAVPGGEVCCELGGEGYDVTGGVKSPRLAGVWARRRLLHNGSVEGLERLFCMDGPRGTDPMPPVAMADTGHLQTCDGLSTEEKQDLIAFLRAWVD